MSEYQNNAVVSYRLDLSDELAIFRVKPDVGTVPSYLPGQYAELALPESQNVETKKLERRSYSIASAPHNLSELEFYIVKVEGGCLTNKLWNLEVGSKLWLGPKIKGKFTLEEVPEKKDLIMVSTGTGLAPFVSMIREHKNNPPWRRVVLVHGARFEKDLGYRKELELWEKENEWFTYLPALTREPDWTGLNGRVQTLFEKGAIEAALKEKLSKESSHILLCGNPQMIDDLQALLESKGLNIHKKKAPGNVHVERYW